MPSSVGAAQDADCAGSVPIRPEAGARTRRPDEASRSPASTQTTRRSWNDDGASPRIAAANKTESTGWRVSSTEVTAAGRRGSDTAITSQPSACELSARRTSQPCARNDGVRSSAPNATPKSAAPSAETAVGAALFGVAFGELDLTPSFRAQGWLVLLDRESTPLYFSH